MHALLDDCHGILGLVLASAHCLTHIVVGFIM